MSLLIDHLETKARPGEHPPSDRRRNHDAEEAGGIEVLKAEGLEHLIARRRDAAARRDRGLVAIEAKATGFVNELDFGGACNFESSVSVSTRQIS
jgi:hypothetical protein